MFLERLELNGFKSFAHKTVLEFKPGITAIVGPNGSGKSNIADSVRWVLGEQSLKLLRGKKSEDVIFSGSDKKARLGLAQVSLYFNNEPDKAGLGLSEICLSRKVYRDGESEYLINKQKTRLLDLQMLLAKAGIAHSSYAIIGQGLVDSFLLASAPERKEFFEEASGIRPWQIKRQQSLNRLEHTEENLATVQIQLQEITPRLHSLTRQVKRLQRRSEIELRLKEVQQKYYTSLWHEINKDCQVKEKELKRIAGDQERVEQKVNELQKEIANLSKDNAQSEKLEKLQSEYQKRFEEKMKIKEKLMDLKIKNTQAAVATKQSYIPLTVNQEVIKVIKALKVLKSKISQALDDNNLGEAKKFLAEQENLINEVDKLLEPFSTEETNEQPKYDNQNKIEKLKKELKNMDEQIDSFQKQIRKESEKEKTERVQIWDWQQNYQREQNKLNGVAAEVNNLRVEVACLETKRDDLASEIRQELGEEFLTERQHPRISPSERMNEGEKRTLVTEIGQLKHQLSLIGGIDPEVGHEYEEIKSRHEFLSTQIDDLKKSISALEKLTLELDEQIKKQFEASFKIINEEFQKYFKILFVGGRAKLILIKSNLESGIPKFAIHDSPLELPDPNFKTQEDSEENEIKKITERLKSTEYAGVDIEATPPGKKLKSISMLSGGERALTSIALLCAIISANPSPFIILDEVDAALDEANSLRFAAIMSELAKKSQFIIITHNRATMEKANILYGVTMGDDGVSTLLSLKLEGVEKYTNR